MQINAVAWGVRRTALNGQRVAIMRMQINVVEWDITRTTLNGQRVVNTIAPFGTGFIALF
jgi:hypothetical protein